MAMVSLIPPAARPAIWGIESGWGLARDVLRNLPMKRTPFIIAGLILLSACRPKAQEPSENPPEASPPQPTAESLDATPAPPPSSHPVLTASRQQNGEIFSTSDNCRMCHSNSPDAQAMRDETGAGIAPYDLWQSTMMANAARDPLWRAVMSAEMASAPEQAEAIAQKCFDCHATMGKGEAGWRKETLEKKHFEEDSVISQLALDGVSCTVCHQIQPDRLGTDESFTAGFVIKQGGYIFGPHSELFSHPMEMHSGYIPMHGEQILDSALCGSCHTVQTHPLDAPETLFTEQAPYLEWRNSAFTTEVESPGPDAASCQGCHVPQTSAAGKVLHTGIARNPVGHDFGPVEARVPFGRHIFVGGNTLIPAMLRDHADELQPRASAAAFDATIARAREQLEQRSARLELGEALHEGPRHSLSITLSNLAGHKLPTGFPSRRLWLEINVTDSAGETVMTSGVSSPRGVLLDAKGQPRPEELAGGPHYTHRNTLTSDSPPLVYEARMADAEGKPTFRVMRAASMHLDNRLLPRGWSPNHSEAKRIAPVGTDEDASFAPGQDTVTVIFEAAPERGPFTVAATLHYQVLSPRWAAELAQTDTPEVRAFMSYYQASRNAGPEQLATASKTFRAAPTTD